jgi:hypothetical protein
VAAEDIQEVYAPGRLFFLRRHDPRPVAEEVEEVLASMDDDVEAALKEAKGDPEVGRSAPRRGLRAPNL